MHRQFADDGDVEFEFQLAELLHRTVAQLRQDLSQREFVQWYVYLVRKRQREELAEKTRRGG